MNLRALVLLAALVASSSCTAAPSAPHTNTQQEDESQYAAALREAFDVYADEVYTAALFDYGSVAEAEAVVRTLSDTRFDYQLEQALVRRGLSTRALARFADKNPVFFHAQQRLHWGKLQELEATLASIPLRVKPKTVDSSLAVLP
jgi:hypothetical protein